MLDTMRRMLKIKRDWFVWVTNYEIWTDVDYANRC